MNILDENVLKSQRQILQSWRISIRQIGYDVGRRGMKDDEIIPLYIVYAAQRKLPCPPWAAELGRRSRPRRLRAQIQRVLVGNGTALTSLRGIANTIFEVDDEEAGFYFRIARGVNYGYYRFSQSCVPTRIH